MIPGEDTAVAHAQVIPLGIASPSPECSPLHGSGHLAPLPAGSIADATTPPVAAEMHTCGGCSLQFRAEEMVHVECAFRRRCAWCALDAIEAGIKELRAGQKVPTLEEVVRGC